MAYRNPEAECWLISGCGVDKAHNHTFRFSSREAQTTYFLNKSKAQWHYTNTSQIRLYEGYIMLRGDANDLYMIDYLMFRNVPSGNNLLSGRWIYAFVDAVEYENDSTIRVNFTIDWIQSYLIDVIMNPQYAYCVRQHSKNDTMYGNTRPEPVNYGGFYYQSLVSGWSNIGVECKLDNDGNFINWYTIIVCPPSIIHPQILTDGIPNVLQYFPATSISLLFEFLNDMEENVRNQIVDVYMYPKYLADKAIKGEQGYYTQKVPLPGKEFNPWERYDFVPKNNKLYTYPYSMITVAGANQSAKEYRAERFERSVSEATFKIYGTMGSVPEFICVPIKYGAYFNQDAEHLNENFVEAVTIKGTPKVPWITDQYKAWLAQKQSQLNVQQYTMERAKALQIPTAIYDMANSIASINPVGIAGGVKSSLEKYSNTSIDLMSQQAQLNDAKNMPLTASNYATSDIYYKCGEYGFRAMYTFIPKEYAELVDQYFTMFGYQMDSLRKPDFFARKSYTYVKYNGYSTANISGMPDSARIQWQNVMMSGITFWESSVGIGNYGADNSV